MLGECYPSGTGKRAIFYKLEVPVSWDFALPLDRGSQEPMFLQVSRTLAAEIRRGRLRPGDALPGSRSLARTLDVHRNTVLAAYAELAAEGWIETSRARGTFVSKELPDPEPHAFAR